MRAGIVVNVAAADRRRLEAIVSGAPVFGENGNLIAILTNSDQNRALAIPTYAFAPALNLPSISRPDDDILAGPETSKTKVNAFTWISPPNEVKRGQRIWTRIPGDQWQQEYPDGTKERSMIVKRIKVAGCDGSVISNPLEPEFQGFIPDKGCINMVFLFRRLPTRTWTKYVSLENLR